MIAAQGTGNHPRRTLRSASGVASTGSPLATGAALDVLRRGGNAVDAAICAAAVQSVVEFPWCGVGGDAFWLIRTPGGEVVALNGSGAAPAALEPDAVSSPIPRFGPMSVAVPGFVDALCAARERFGVGTLAELFEPAVGYARDGFALSAEPSRAIERVRPSLRADSSLGKMLHANGTAMGETFRQPQLARTLEAVAAGGRDAFYRGPTAEALSRCVRAGGGLLAAADLAQHTSAWVEPISVIYRDVAVYTQPPVSLGCVMLQQLRMYERLGVPALGFDDPVRIDAMVRCKHAAFADVLGTLSDDQRSAAHVAALLSDAHVDRRCEQIYSTAVGDLDRRAVPVTGNDTTCLTVLDSQGTAVTLIHSLFNEFGSRLYEPTTGVLLNDRLANQVVGLGPNEIMGGRKPLHTLSAFLLERDGRAVMAGATPGGRGQVQINFQVIVNAVDCGMDQQAAVTAPRWLSGAPRRAEPNRRLYLEQGLGAAVGGELRRRGHDVMATGPADTDLFGSVVTVGADGAGGLLAAADHRREATAGGF